MANYITEPQARIINDSISPDGHRLTTMEVTMHRFVLAEFNTHRVFSRNSASSRAIPGHLHRTRVLTSPAVPLEFPQKLAGMQGGEALGPELEARAAALWRKAALEAATTASKLDKLGVHKSVTNRLLEPFLMQTVLVTSTEWDNFFKQRAHEAAQPEIRVPAELMLQAYEQSVPTELRHGEWHLPLVQIDDDDCNALNEYALNSDDEQDKGYSLLKRVSVARCARVSYLNHDGDRNIEDDLKLYKRLETYGHWSPFEHVATPCAANPHVIMGPTARGTGVKAYESHLGNFHGWDQLRHRRDGTTRHSKETT